MENNIGKITQCGLGKSLEKDFLSYSKYVIEGRAITNLRDGLKPVQRRILYSMWRKSLLSNKPHRKSVTIVGEVLGNYHPHGDSSVYGAMVLMAQDFHTRYPLVDGHGNFGSVDGDPAAAYRYTEARLSKVGEAVLSHIDDSSLESEFFPNFDDTKVEPFAINSLVPLSLLNGTKGVAVGITANTMPHNATEVYNAVYGIIDRRLNDEDEGLDADIVLKSIKGPDFPTGGKVSGDIEQIIKYGFGKICISGTMKIIPEKNMIRITEMPYLKERSKMISEILKIPEVLSVSDNSKKETDIRIKIKKGTNLESAASRIKRKCGFSYSQTIEPNYILLNGGLKSRVSILENIQYFLDSSIETCRIQLTKRRNKKRIEKRKKELTIIAKNNIDFLVKMVKDKAENEIKYKNLLKKKLEVSDEDFEFITSLRLNQLKNKSIEEIKEQLISISNEIEEISNILNNDKELLKYTKKEIAATGVDVLKKDKRLTEVSSKPLLSHRDDNLDMLDIKLEENYVLIEENKIRTMSIAEADSKIFKTQNRGGKGKNSKNLSQIVKSNTREILYTIDDEGKVYKIANHRIPSTFSSIVNLIDDFDTEREIKAFVSEKSIKDCESIICVSEKGMVSRIAREKIMSNRTSYQLFKTRDDDKIESVSILEPDTDIDTLVLFTSGGYCPMLKIEQFACKGRKSLGYKSVKLQTGQKVISSELLDTKGINFKVVEKKAVTTDTDEKTVVDAADVVDVSVDTVDVSANTKDTVVADVEDNCSMQVINLLSNGKGKRTPLSSFPVPAKSRNIKGPAYARVEKNEVVFAGIVDTEKDNILSVIADGKMINVLVSKITETKTRQSKGSKIVSSSKKIKSISACLIEADANATDEAEKTATE